MESSWGSTATSSSNEVHPRIRWTRTLIESLQDTSEEAEPLKRGYYARLEELWSSQNPTLPSTGSALVQTLRRHANDPPVPTDPCQSPETDQTGQDSEPNRVLISQMKSEISVYLKQVSAEPATKLTRVKAMAKGWKRDEKLLDCVDQAMVELWEEEELKTIWTLNRLMYAGAQVVTEKVQGGEEVEEEEEEDEGENVLDLDSQPGNQYEDMGEMIHDPWEGLVQPEMLMKTSEEKRKVGRSKEETIRSLRKTIGWLDAEATRLKQGGGRKSLTKKRCILLKKLHRLFGREAFTQKRLRSLREKQAALLRVKTLQKQRSTRKEAETLANKMMRVHGPTSINGRAPTKLPTAEDLQGISRFWKGVWEETGTCDLSHTDIVAWKRRMRTQSEPAPEDETLSREVAWEGALKKLRNWTAPGPDGIPGYWLRRFSKTVRPLEEMLSGILDQTCGAPDWLVRGRTVLIPKEGSTGQPDQYRPITCLNTMYKLLTGMLTAILMKHVIEKDLLPEEQKALRKRRRGCLDAIVIDQSVALEAKMYRRNLSVAWIDYRKAFDMVPHKLVRMALKSIRAPKQVRRTVRTLVKKWRTDIAIYTSNGIKSIPISLQRGIFQGDSLSPLLFCLCVSPLSLMLGKSQGFTSNYQLHPVTHLMFMDDLKVYEQSSEMLAATVLQVENLSNALGMTLGLNKCATANMVEGKVGTGGSISVASGEMTEVEYGGSYKYLGLSQLFLTSTTKTKTRVKREYFSRVRKTWESGLNSRNKVTMTNSWAVSVLRYFYGAMRWCGRDFIEIDRRTRKIMKQCGSHHANASVARLYIPRKAGGRGLQSVQAIWEREVVSSGAYLMLSTDPQVQGAMALQRELRDMGKYSFVGSADLVLEKRESTSYLVPMEETLSSESETPKGMVKFLKHAQLKELQTTLSGKAIHGIYYNQTRRSETDTKCTYAWLTEGKLRSETESLIVAAQDGVVHTAVYKSKIQGNPGSLACRLCNEAEETVGHILSSCDRHRWGLYKDRHDRVLYQLVKATASILGIGHHRSIRAPGGVARGGVMGTNHKMLLIDQNLPTDRTVEHTRPDLVVRLTREKKIYIFEVACAWEPLVQAREREKWSKYQELAADLAQQWKGFRVLVIPIVVGDLGLVVGMRKQLEKTELFTDGESERLVRAIQRDVLCSAVRIIRRHMAVC